MSRESLATFDQLPDLLAIAREEVGSGSQYRRQDELRKRASGENRPYRWSMPLRHLLRCPECSQQMAEVIHEIGDGTRAVKMNSMDLHRAREHGVPLPSDVEMLLRRIADHLA